MCLIWTFWADRQVGQGPIKKKKNTGRNLQQLLESKVQGQRIRWVQSDVWRCRAWLLRPARANCPVLLLELVFPFCCRSPHLWNQPRSDHIAATAHEQHLLSFAPLLPSHTFYKHRAVDRWSCWRDATTCCALTERSNKPPVCTRTVMSCFQSGEQYYITRCIILAAPKVNMALLSGWLMLAVESLASYSTQAGETSAKVVKNNPC